VVGLRLDLSIGLGLTTMGVRLGLNLLSGLRLNALVVVTLNISSILRLDVSSGPRLDTLVVKLRLSILGVLRLDTWMVGLRLSVSSGSLGNLEGNTSQYDLRKRPRGVAHWIWMEEEPLDSADLVSYWDTFAHLRLGQKWSDVIELELRSLAENSTWTMLGWKTFQLVSHPLAPGGSSRPRSCQEVAFGIRPGLSSEVLNSRWGLTSMKPLLS